MIGQKFGIASAFLAALSAAGIASAASSGRNNQVKALEARLSDLEAKEEIRQLFNRYAFTADTGDAKGWSEVWAEDAVYEGNNIRIVGREAFYKAAADSNGAHMKDIVGKGSLHTTGPLLIQVDGARAWAEGHTLVWVRKDEG